ncbi:MAG: helix-turn-helix domain-containing protein [Bacteroidota bacterium]
MQEVFIEQATTYPLEHGQLVVYETNGRCYDVAFKFDHHVMTIMLAGHKSVVAAGKRFEFFPGTFFIPRKDIVQKVDIPSASLSNPTKCLELRLDHAFLQAYYDELRSSENANYIFRQADQDPSLRDFVSNDERIIDIFKRLYRRRIQGDDPPNQMIVTLIVKELLLEVFQTDGLFLLREDFASRQPAKSIQRCLDHIKQHLGRKLTSRELSEVAGLGLTSFFNKFKKEVGMSPTEYINHRRIVLAQSFLRNGNYSLKEAAYNSGFKSYEHFCGTFKKVVGQTPSAYKASLDY